MFKIFCCVIALVFAPVIYGANNIVLVGDSLSAAHGIALQSSWVSIIKNKIKSLNCPYTLINASIGGDTTSDGLSKLPKLLKQYKPAIVVIELGGNDGLRGLSLKNMQQNLADMIQQSQKSGTKVLLLGVRLPPNYGPEYTQAFQQVYQNLEQKFSIKLVLKILLNVGGYQAMMQHDGIHPTTAAQATIAKNIWPTLRSMLQC